jgi:hypothetical protein
MRNLIVATGLIVAVAATRFLPHPPNFSPVMAVALFGSAVFANRYMGLILALAAMALSDVGLGAHSTLPFVYIAMLGAGALGFLLRKDRTVTKIIGATLAGSVLFFVVTNFGVFVMQDLYAKNLQGLVECYAMALPFFQNSLAGDIVFSGALFSLHHILVVAYERRLAASAA